MSDKLDRFTNSAVRALSLSQEEALRHNSQMIGTEHLLLALVREEEGIPVKVLRALGVEPGQVTRAVERTVHHEKIPPSGRPPLAPGMKRTIELAVDEACQTESAYIGTEHLLLGLVHEEEGIAVQVLHGLGVDLDHLRTQTAQHIWLAGAQAKRVSQTPLVEEFADDLTAAGEAGRLGTVIGRQAEIGRLIQILGRRTKNNPLLIGEPGVGKTTIVKGLVQRMLEGQVPASLLERRLLMLDGGSLVVGSMYRKLLEEIISSKAILFVDEVHILIGSARSSMDGANFLKAALSRGELQLIGATTPEAYRRYCESEVAREWPFQTILVKEPSIEETMEILRRLKFPYEGYHNVRYSDEALAAAARLAARYVPDRCLPDKALDLLDEAGSWVRMHRAPDADALRETFLHLKGAQKMKRYHDMRDKRFGAQPNSEAIEWRAREVELEARFNELRARRSHMADQLRVTPGDVAEVVSSWTGVSLSVMADEECAAAKEGEDEQ